MNFGWKWEEFTSILDINYERSNVMTGRCFAKNPKIVSELAKSFMSGAKKIGISSICKHYPGHGYAKTTYV